jgi:hypothetical protein
MKTMFRTLIASAAAFLFVSAQMGEVRADAGQDQVSACDGHKGEKSEGKADEKGKCGESCKGCDKCGTDQCSCGKDGCSEGCGCGKKSK